VGIGLRTSQTVLYLDALNGVVHISEDEGKIWRVVEDIPNGAASHFVNHSFDDRMVSTSVVYGHGLTCPVSLGLCLNTKTYPLRNRGSRAHLEKL
jgi:hypothetical protein